MKKSLNDIIRRCRSRNALWFVLFGVGMGLYLVGMPKSTDDYWYMNHLQDWFTGQGVFYPENGGNILTYGIPLDKIIEIWKDHWKDDNIRLGNLMAPFLLLGPKWIWSSLLVIMWMAAIYLLGSFAEVDMRRSPLVVVLLAMLTFYMPWSEQFGGLVFQINYLATTLLAAILLIEFFKGNVTSDMPALAMLFLLGFVTSWWHEGFGVPISAGAGAVFLLYKKYRNKRTAAIILGLLSGILIMVFTPGMQSRARAYLQHIGLRWLDIWGFIYVWSPGILALFAGVLAMIRVGFKRVMNDPKVAFLLVSGIVSLTIMLITINRLRGAWWYYIMATICTVYFLRVGFGRYWCRYRLHNALIVAPLLALCFVYWGSVGYAVIKMREDIERGFYEGIEHPEKSRFCKYASVSDLPVMSGYLPLVWRDYEELYDIPLLWARKELPNTEYYNYGPKDFSRGGIPEELRFVTSESGCELAGKSGIRSLKGSLFMKPTEADIRPMEENRDLYIAYRTRVGFGKGYGVAEVHGVLFRSEGDGKLYIYLRPRFDWYVSHFKTLQYMEIIENMAAGDGK